MYMHTHMCENKDEISLVKDLFKSDDYVSAYSRHGLLGPRSVFAHCVHMQDGEWAALRESKSVIAFCPTSNFFLGSGTFDLARCDREGVRVGLGTDIGAGTSFCQLQTLGDGYKGARGCTPPPFRRAGARRVPRCGRTHTAAMPSGHARLALTLSDRPATPPPQRWRSKGRSSTPLTPCTWQRCGPRRR